MWEMSEKMISVIIPVYNSEKYLEDCLNTVIDQTYKDLEIICVNDGSTDKSLSILTQFSQRDSRIKVISKHNEGVSSARNTGIDCATGEYIAFVDSDDELDVALYETLFQLAKECDADVTHCSYQKIDLDGTRRDIGGSGIILEQESEEAIDFLLKGKYFTGSPCNKLYKRDTVDKSRFDETLKINEDVWFNFEVFCKSERIVFVDKPLYKYYEREFSSCAITLSTKKSSDCAKVARYIMERCKNTKLETISLYKYYIALMNEFRSYLFSEDYNKKEEMEKIKYRMQPIRIQLDKIPLKYRMNWVLMLRVPRIYKMLYKWYDKVRKPNWDIN